MAKGRYVVVAASVTAAVVALGVAFAPIEPSPLTRPTSAPPNLPLAQIELAEVNTTRTPFCDAIEAVAVTDAVGAAVEPTEIVNGAELGDAAGDVSHELGCSYSQDGTTARVWVFAAPVTTYDAGLMVRDATAEPGCSRAGALIFGRPGAVLECRTPTERVLRAVGRIGDAWVHCELAEPVSTADSSLVLRGQRWCVAAVYAMD